MVAALPATNGQLEAKTAETGMAALLLLVLTQFVHAARMIFGFGGIHFRDATTKFSAGFGTFLGRFDATYAAPALSSLRRNLPHLFNRVMRAAVITKFGHRLGVVNGFRGHGISSVKRNNSR